MAAKAFSKLKQYSTEKGKLSIENEVRLMRKLNHPNVVHFEGLYETENSLYIILEYLEGAQLNSLLRSGIILSEVDSKRVLSNILRALVYMAEKGVVHRDLKPENIMLRDGDNYDLAICDFGLAIFANDERYLFVRCGTPGFVSP